MDRDESEVLLQQLFEIAEDPAIIYEHVWRVGDLVMWDNLACLHARTDWPKQQRRTLRSGATALASETTFFPGLSSARL